MNEASKKLKDDELIRIAQSMLAELRLISRLFEKQLRTNRCTTSIIDLTVAHNDTPLKIEYKGRVYLFLDVERVDSPFTYRLGQVNSPNKSEVFTAPTATFFHEFTEIYVTNAAALGIGVILTGWYEDK